jgi:small-conductance mechanosensitive channel
MEVLMKRKSVPVFLFFIVMTLLFGLCFNSAAQSHQQLPMDSKEIQQVIELLENPEASNKLAHQLKNLLDARQQLEEKPPAETEKKEAITTNLFQAYRSYKKQVIAGAERAVSRLKALPQTLKQLRMYFSKDEHVEELVSILIKFTIALLAGLIAWIGLRRYTKRLEQKLGLEPPFTFFKRLAGVLVSTFFKILPWISLYLFGYLALVLFPMDRRLESIILRGLLAFIVYFTIKYLIHFMLSPEVKEKRLLPLKAELSAYMIIWCQRILLFSLWIYLLLTASAALNKPSLVAILLAIYQCGMFLFLTIILVQWKQEIEKGLRLPVRGEDPPWKSRLKILFNYIARKIYLIAIIYTGLLVATSLLGLSRIKTYFLYSTGESILAILFFIGLWVLWGFVFRKIFEVSNDVKTKYPDLEQQVNRYTQYLGTGVYLVITLFAGLTLLSIWGLDLYEWIVTNPERVRIFVHIPIIIMLTIFLTQLTHFVIGHLEGETKKRMLAAATSPPAEVEKRVSTLGRIFRKATMVVITSFGGIAVLSELGFDIKPILAGAGIIGLAVGFGAQNLVRDIISGLFFIFENRIRVGDVAIINGTGGLVEQVNLRTVVLRGLDGTVHVFPNGGINSLSNMTYLYSYYLFDVGVAYKEDTDRVVAVLKQLSEEMMGDEHYGPAILEPLEILGVDKFDDSAVIIKARMKTLPIKQWFVGREMNRRMKKRFDELGIEIPFPHRSLYFGEASKAIRVQVEGSRELKDQKEEIKGWIREVLRESS